MTHAASQGDHITFNQIAQKQFANYTLKRDAIRLVLSGRTTVAEAMRASTPDLTHAAIRLLRPQRQIRSPLRAD